MESLPKGEFTFAAGEMTIVDKKVHANTDKGELRFFTNPETCLLSLEWKNLTKNTNRDIIIITPGEWVYKTVSVKKGSPFFFQGVTYPEEKYFFYYQIPKDSIEEVEKKIKEILTKGEIPVDPKTSEQKKEEQNVPMSIEELNNNKNGNNNQNGQNVLSQQQQQQASDFLKNFSEVMKKLKQKYPSLNKIVTREKVEKLFDSLNDAEKKQLIDLLPESQRTVQGFHDNVSSAQFKQGLGSLTHALESENLGAIIQSFGLDINEAQKYSDGVEAFVKCIIKKYSTNESKKDDEKENKK